MNDQEVNMDPQYQYENYYDAEEEENNQHELGQHENAEENIYDNTNQIKTEEQEIVTPCIKCQQTPSEYISLNCNHNFCLNCLAFTFINQKTQMQQHQNDENLIEIQCEFCQTMTELDKQSIDALEQVIQDAFNNINQEEDEEGQYQQNYDLEAAQQQVQQHDIADSPLKKQIQKNLQNNQQQNYYQNYEQDLEDEEDEEQDHHDPFQINNKIQQINSKFNNIKNQNDQIQNQEINNKQIQQPQNQQLNAIKIDGPQQQFFMQNGQQIKSTEEEEISANQLPENENNAYNQIIYEVTDETFQTDDYNKKNLNGSKYSGGAGGANTNNSQGEFGINSAFNNSSNSPTRQQSNKQQQQFAVKSDKNAEIKISGEKLFQQDKKNIVQQLENQIKMNQLKEYNNNNLNFEDEQKKLTQDKTIQILQQQNAHFMRFNNTNVNNNNKNSDSKVQSNSKLNNSNKIPTYQQWREMSSSNAKTETQNFTTEHSINSAAFQISKQQNSNQKYTTDPTIIKNKQQNQKNQEDDVEKHLLLHSSSSLNPQDQLSIITEDNTNNIYCQIHPYEEAILFCNTCKSACICITCIVEGLHQNHDIQNVVKGFNMLVDVFKQFNYKIEAKVQSFKQMHQRIGQKKVNIEKKVQEINNQVRKNLRELKKLIDQKEQELAQETKKICENQCQNIAKVEAQFQEQEEYLLEMQKILAQNYSYENYKNNISKVIQLFNFYSHHQQKLSSIIEEDIEKQIPQLKNFLNLQYKQNNDSFAQHLNQISVLKLDIEKFKFNNHNTENKNQNFKQSNSNNNQQQQHQQQNPNLQQQQIINQLQMQGQQVQQQHFSINSNSNQLVSFQNSGISSTVEGSNQAGVGNIVNSQLAQNNNINDVANNNKFMQKLNNFKQQMNQNTKKNAALLNIQQDVDLLLQQEQNFNNMQAADNEQIIIQQQQNSSKDNILKNIHNKLSQLSKISNSQNIGAQFLDTHQSYTFNSPSSTTATAKNILQNLSKKSKEVISKSPLVQKSISDSEEAFNKLLMNQQYQKENASLKNFYHKKNSSQTKPYYIQQQNSYMVDIKPINKQQLLYTPQNVTANNIIQSTENNLNLKQSNTKRSCSNKQTNLQIRNTTVAALDLSQNNINSNLLTPAIKFLDQQKSLFEKKKTNNVLISNFVVQ